jgi:hypothetical protein
MTPLFKKMSFKGHPTVYLFDAPDSFGTEVEAMTGVTQVQNQIPSQPLPEGAYALGFVLTQAQVDILAHIYADYMPGDATLWIAYPKGTSKRYKCDFNRDTGWGVLGQLGFEPVRQIAIDEDWSALRFRRVQYIKVMTRSFAMTEEGKAKVAKKG